MFTCRVSAFSFKKDPLAPAQLTAISDADFFSLSRSTQCMVFHFDLMRVCTCFLFLYPIQIVAPIHGLVFFFASTAGSGFGAGACGRMGRTKNERHRTVLYHLVTRQENVNFVGGG